MLSERQQRILNLVVDAYLESGRPVPSKSIAERGDVEWGPSTVRAELAELERAGYLNHPHTSAGRVPTENGYRHYATEVLQRLEPRESQGFPLEAVQTGIESALQATTEMLAGATRLLALVSAPPLETEPSATSRCCCSSRTS